MQVLSNVIREHIKDLMQQQNLTVSELARRSGLTQSTVDSVLHTHFIHKTQILVLTRSTK